MIRADDVAAGMARVRDRIAACDRDPSEVTVVAMTKGFGADALHAAIEAGIVDVGESYADGLLAKAAEATGAAGAVRWHFTGAIQRNKVARLAPHVAVWHGLDRQAAAQAIAAKAPGATVLVQVNLAGLAGRNGCSWEDAAAVVDQARDASLDVAGLMGVASPEPAAAAREFARLADLAASLGLRELSMGMTGDLEAALRAGATIVRIGQALFGARQAAHQVRR